LAKPLIINVWGIESGKVNEGSAYTFRTAWVAAQVNAKIVLVSTGDRHQAPKLLGPDRIELVISSSKPSKNKFVRLIVQSIFKELAPNVLLNLDSLSYSFDVIIRLRKILRASDRIHTYQFWFALFCQLIPSFKNKLVYTELGGEWAELAQGRASKLVKVRYGVIGKFVLSRIRVIAQSSLNKKFMVQCGIPPKNICVVRHARSDPRIFYPIVSKPQSPFRVLYVGRIIPQKGLHILINAANILINEKHLKNITFTIVGPAGGFRSNSPSLYYNLVRERINDNNLSIYFDFKGHVPLEELVKLYSMAHVCVQPSLQDAYPFSVTEAQMCGTPVIGTKSGGMIEMIEDGVTGYLIPVNDADKLAERLEYLIKHPNECLEMGIQARNRAIRLSSIEDFPRELLACVLGEERLT
jgi:glycosyltransferase involved in cell wall biosynthesis